MVNLFSQLTPNSEIILAELHAKSQKEMSHFYIRMIKIKWYKIDHILNLFSAFFNWTDKNFMYIILYCSVLFSVTVVGSH